MIRKAIITFIPTTIALLLVIIFLQVRETAIEYLYPDHDPVFLLQPLFDIEIFLPGYLVILVIALAFQFFVANKVWHIYKQSNQVVHLKLWQLVTLCCLVFGTVSGFFIWHDRTGIQALLVKIFCGTILAMIYWIANLITISLLDKKKYGS